MKPGEKYKMLSDERLESLLLEMRPPTPDEPLHPRIDDLTRRRVTSAVLAELEDAPHPRQRVGADFRRYGLAAALAVVSVTAAVLFGMHITYDSPTSNAASSSSVAANEMTQSASDQAEATENVVPQSRFSLLQGEVNCGDRAVKLGATVPMAQWIETRNGQSAFALPTGIAVGLSDNSSVRVFWNGNRRYEVEVNQGMALFSVNPQRTREGFFVRTPKGTIQVTGTLFTVIVEDEGDVSVHLHRGELKIVSDNQVPHRMRAGNTAVMQEDEVGIAPSTENMQVAQQMYKMGCIDGGQTFSELADVDCNLGYYGARAGLRAKAFSGRSGGAASAKVSVEELLQQGREARRAKQWQAAATAYRTLIRMYPTSPDSRTALVTLAQIELQQLNDPRSALRHYQSYLKSPGALAQEALYGKSKAYRQLGESAKELKMLQQLVADYPSGPVSKAAASRISVLQTQQR